MQPVYVTFQTRAVTDKEMNKCKTGIIENISLEFYHIQAVGA